MNTTQQLAHLAAEGDRQAAVASYSHAFLFL